MIINNIQILRFFAASSVLLFHIAEYSKTYNYNPKLLSFFEGWGYNGVDIFFVITGFVIYISNKNDYPLSFIKKRFLRILPIYYFYTLTFIFIFILFPNLFRGTEINYQDIYQSFFLISTILDNKPIINLGWTIEIEIYFTLIFFISLYFKDFKNKAIAISIILLIFSFYSFLFIEFMFGLIIGYMYEKKLFFKYTKQFLIVGIFSLFLSKLITFDAIKLFHVRAIIYGIPSSLIIIGLAYYKNLNLKTLTYLGKASYSIYLVHLFTLPALLKLNNLLKINFIYDDIFLLIIYFISVFVGVISFHFVESKILNLRKN